MESNKKSNFLLELKYCFKSSTRIYFVSEYIEGGSIYSRVESGRLYNEKSLKFIAAQIVLALNELHGKEILHRYLKPENVLIRENGYIMLTGYRLAKIMIHPNLTNTICGTPCYLAPEIIRQKEQTFAIDWWCFGILLYDLFTGKTPFESKQSKILYGNSLTIIFNKL
jgi:serine/threonine protein kinase